MRMTSTSTPEVPRGWSDSGMIVRRACVMSENLPTASSFIREDEIGVSFGRRRDKWDGYQLRYCNIAFSPAGPVFEDT